MSSLLQPDTVATAQYFATRGKGTLGPQERLMLAVLEDAIMCFQKYAGARDGKGERLFLEAEKWILEEDRDWPFSFENISETLKLDPNYIRRGLLMWRKEEFLIGPLKKKRRFLSRARMDGFRRIASPSAA